VIEASTGTSAIEIFSLERPDIVVLDLSMEDIGGIDVLRTLRQLDTQARVIVVSADIQRSTAQAVMTAGASQFVPKPASAEDLVTAVNALTENPS
jgi:two-component system chemotaxis response regulator CheY